MLRSSLVLVVVGTLLAAGCGGSESAEPVAADRPTELTTVDQLRDGFESDAGSARLVLLLSPT